MGCLGIYTAFAPQVSLPHDVIGWREGRRTAWRAGPAYSIHGLQVFQGFPRASVGHGKKLTGCSRADHGLCSMCQLWCRGAAGQLGSWVGNVWGLGVVSVHDQTQQQSWHELAGVGSHMHGEALRGHAPSVSSP